MSTSTYQLFELMMILIIKCIAGFTLLLIQVNETRSQCEVKTNDLGYVYANCSYTADTSVPQDLPTNLQILDIENNNFTELGQDDLKNYPKLWALFLVNLTNVSYLPEGYFKYTPLLEVLNISGTNISEFNEVPVTVAYFTFNFYRHLYMNISHLSNLKRLRVRIGTLISLPQIHVAAPMEVLDSKFNPLIQAHYIQIAPFCQLEYFGLQSNELSQANYTFTCCGLRRWAFRRLVTTGYYEQECSRELYPACAEVPFNFTEESVELWRDCMRVLRKRLFFKILGTVIAIVSFLGIISGLVFYFHRKKFSQAEAVKENPAPSDAESSAPSDAEEENEADQE